MLILFATENCMILLRIFISLLLACAPFAAFIVSSGKPENMLLLIIPFFGAVPAVIGALLVFVPIECKLEASGLRALKNVLVPAAGTLLVLIFMVIMGLTSGSLVLLFKRLFADPAGVGVWMVLGGLWGVVWRISAGVAALFARAR